MTYTSTQSLVVTVIVLLILAGISISMISGENGILTRTTEAKEKTIIGQEKEAIGIGWNALMQEKWLYDTDITNIAFQEELNRNGNDVTVTTDDEGNFLVYFEDTKHTYKVEKDGKITLIENVAEVEPTEIIYVTLYTDGTLAFSSNNSTDLSKTVSKTYTIAKGVSFDTEDMIPWKNERSSILKVLFVNEVVPTSTARWFYNCSNLSTIESIEKLNTSQVTTMAYMFTYSPKITKLDLSSFDTSKVTSMRGMFGGFIPTDDDLVWSSQTNMALTEINLSSFNTSNVTNMINLFNMPNDSSSKLKTIVFGNKWNTSKVTNMQAMFIDCSSLISLDLSNFDTKNVTNMQSMFNNCSSLTGLDVSKFDTSSVTDMYGMFFACNSITNLDLSSFDTSNVINMKEMFGNYAGVYSKYETIDLSGKFDTSKVQDMRWMFANCNKLKTIYATDRFVTTAVTDGHEMFLNCTSLKGENGTTYSSSSMNYARIDRTGQQGYFTLSMIMQSKLEDNTLLEYIGSTGTQYIDTRFKPNQDTRIIADFEYTNNSQGYRFTGSENISSNTQKFRFGTSQGIYWMIGYGSQDYKKVGSSDTSRHILDFNKNIIFLDNKKLCEFDYEIFNAYGNAYIFSINSDNIADLAPAKLYSYKIYDNETLVKDYIPVHNTITNSAGLYDKVNKRFYPNNGTATFTEGPEKTKN